MPRIPACASPAETERLVGGVPPPTAEPDRGEICVLGAAQTIGARERQEDHFAVLEPADAAFGAHAGVLALVADGMGGMAHGATASRTAVAAFKEAWEQKAPEESIPDALLRCLLASNRAVCAAASSLGAAEEMGSTLVAAVACGERLHWITVGDSLLLLVRDGETTVLNAPHVYARELDELAERGAIAVWQALGDLSRDSLTSFIGMSDLAVVDRTLRGFPLRSGDLVLATSDGVTNALPEAAILAVCAEAGVDAQNIAQGLVRCVETVGLSRQDNATVVAMVPGGSHRAVMLPVPLPDGNSASGVLTRAAVVGPGLNPLEVRPHRGAGKPGEGRTRRLPMLATVMAILIGSLLILLGVVFGPGLWKQVPEVPAREPAPKAVAPVRGRETAPGADVAVPPVAPRPGQASPAAGPRKQRRRSAQDISGDVRTEEVP